MKFFFATCCAIFPLLGNEPRTQPLEQEDWDFLTTSCSQYIRQHADDIEVMTNESGFYRVKIRLPKVLDRDIVDIRFNFWSGEEDLIVDENIHNHPNYFESKIIHGSYDHELFIETENPEAPGSNFLRCKIEKAQNTRSIIDKQQVRLAVEKVETVQAGDHIAIPPSLIHRIVKFDPKTLSINVVYGEEGEKKVCYDVFFTEGSDPENQINLRETLTGSERDAIIEEIIHLLENQVTS
jgi:hypothetical protein